MAALAENARNVETRTKNLKIGNLIVSLATIQLLAQILEMFKKKWPTILGSLRSQFVTSNPDDPHLIRPLINTVALGRRQPLPRDLSCFNSFWIHFICAPLKCNCLCRAANSSN
jgi:hypothetical protein